MTVTKRSLMLAPWVFTIGFFALWELVCRVLGVSSFVLPAPSTILLAIWEYRNQLTYHASSPVG
jgi:NitT/TauT family transport system permease protein